MRRREPRPNQTLGMANRLLVCCSSWRESLARGWLALAFPQSLWHLPTLLLRFPTMGTCRRSVFHPSLSSALWGMYQRASSRRFRACLSNRSCATVLLFWPPLPSRRCFSPVERGTNLLQLQVHSCSRAISWSMQDCCLGPNQRLGRVLFDKYPYLHSIASYTRRFSRFFFPCQPIHRCASIDMGLEGLELQRKCQWGLKRRWLTSKRHVRSHQSEWMEPVASSYQQRWFPRHADPPQELSAELSGPSGDLPLEVDLCFLTSMGWPSRRCFRIPWASPAIQIIAFDSSQLPRILCRHHQQCLGAQGYLQCLRLQDPGSH